jgi:outer membrane biosynthesis protein TonB
MTLAQQMNQINVVDSLENDPNDSPYVVVEESATFRGGDINSFRIYIQETITFPPECADVDVFGKVIVQFCVNKYGKVVDVRVIKGVHPILDIPTVKAFEDSNKTNTWKPAMQNHKPVKQMFTIPIVYYMQ